MYERCFHPSLFNIITFLKICVPFLSFYNKTMNPSELAKLIGIEEIDVKNFLAEQKIMKIEENYPMSREECVVVASHFIYKLKLKVDKQGEIRKGLINVFSFKRTEALFKFLDNDK